MQTDQISEIDPDLPISAQGALVCMQKIMSCFRLPLIFAVADNGGCIRRCPARAGVNDYGVAAPGGGNPNNETSPKTRKKNNSTRHTTKRTSDAPSKTSLMTQMGTLPVTGGQRPRGGKQEGKPGNHNAARG